MAKQLKFLSLEQVRNANYHGALARFCSVSVRIRPFVAAVVAVAISQGLKKRPVNPPKSIDVAMQQIAIGARTVHSCGTNRFGVTARPDSPQNLVSLTGAGRASHRRRRPVVSRLSQVPINSFS